MKTEEMTMQSTQLPPLACSVDADENFYDNSTAPTSPDGSLTFSPVLQALKLRDALERSSPTKNQARNVSPFTDVNSSAESSRTTRVCCIGAGYVGKSQVLELAHRPTCALKPSASIANISCF
jgi:hypothetical protein